MRKKKRRDVIKNKATECDKEMRCVTCGKEMRYDRETGYDMTGGKIRRRDVAKRWDVMDVNVR